ncbi:hypothetical protein H1R20_g3347, partial [Candolleomyces eurysporus]
MALPSQQDHAYSKPDSLTDDYGGLEAHNMPEKEAMLSKHPKDNISQSRIKRGRKRSKFLSIRYIVPLLTLSIQTILLSFLWIFFAVTSRAPVALPDSIARAVKVNAQPVLMVVSLFATVISIVSSFLFTRSIRYSLGRFLSGPLPISFFNFGAAVKLSRKKPVIAFKSFAWTFSSIVLVMSTASQTASWTTLLTPKEIPVTAALQGFELDISSEAFGSLMLANRDVVTPEFFAHSLPLVTQSGATAASTRFSQPSILNFNQLSYINSTSGTLPATWMPWVTPSTSARGSSIPASISFGAFRPSISTLDREPFPVSFSLTQQGFTSRVECRSATLSGTSRPSIFLSSATETVGEDVPGATPQNITVSMMTTGCTGDGYTSLNYDGSNAGNNAGLVRGRPVFTNAARDAVFGTSCAVVGGDGRPHWDLILVGTGRYSFMGNTICSLWPLTTSVDVEYQDASSFFNSSFPSFINHTRVTNETSAPWLGQFATDIFLQGVVGEGQSTAGSSLGDVIRGFVVGPDGSQVDQALVPRVLEAYVRGVLEFSVTLLRTAYSSSNNGLYPNSASEIPENLRRPLNGTYVTETIGCIVGLTSIFVIIFSMWWTSRVSWKTAGGRGPALTEAEDRAQTFFDPDDLLHVITASRAGGLTHVDFLGYDEKPDEWERTVGIKLGSASYGVGFVTQ